MIGVDLAGSAAELHDLVLGDHADAIEIGCGGLTLDLIGVIDQKIEFLLGAYASQCSKPWFDAASFPGLARLRGVECASPSRFAEAFHARKLVLAL